MGDRDTTNIKLVMLILTLVAIAAGILAGAWLVGTAGG